MKVHSSAQLQLVSSLVLLTSAMAAPTVVSGASGLSYIGLRNATAGQDYFLGIPFAQPPLGSLRFRPPVPWSSDNVTAVNATGNSDSCEQAIVSTTNGISEDCLTLNIWKPTNATDNLPVMVWIYGGGFNQGDIQRFPGTYLVERSTKIRKPIIYVAMNYRTGIYGFPPGSAAASAGAVNLGLQDQRIALEWVQKNIQYFGGDPSKVTIFGNSAGSISSAYQSMYKGGEIGGMFRGMILGSGSPSTFPVRLYNDPARETAFQFLVNATSCTGSESPFECVRNAPADVLSQANMAVVNLGNHVTTGPTMAPGDDFLPGEPAALIHDGKFAKVPFISGDQLDEGTGAVAGVPAETDQDLINAAMAFGLTDVTQVQELMSYYSSDPAEGSPYNTGNQTFGQGAEYKRLASVAGDYAFHAPRRDHLRTAAKFGVKTWSYLMSEQPIDFAPVYGIRHGGNVPFIMQSASVTKPSMAPTVVELQETIGGYYICFAYNLDPNPNECTGSQAPYWPSYAENTTAIQFLSSNVTAIQDTYRAPGIDYIISTGLYK